VIGAWNKFVQNSANLSHQFDVLKLVVAADVVTFAVQIVTTFGSFEREFSFYRSYRTLAIMIVGS
jgi:hypothetical protein